MKEPAGIPVGIRERPFWGVGLMKYSAWVIAFLLVLGATASWAETVYISDYSKINMRSGKGTDFRIVSILKTGQQVDLVEVGDGWAKIRLSDGKEGWVLSRLLTDKEPCKRVLSRVETDLAKAREQVLALKKENARLRGQNTALSSEATTNNQVTSQLQEEYDTLKAESAQLFELKQAMEEATREAERQKHIAVTAESELGDLRSDVNWRWFLSGAAVLFFGIVIGIIGRRRRSPTLLR